MNENTVIEGVLTLPVHVVRVGTMSHDTRLILADTKEPYRVPHCLEDAEGRNIAFLYRVATDQEMTTETLAQTEARAEYIAEAVSKWAEAKRLLGTVKRHLEATNMGETLCDEIGRILA